MKDQQHIAALAVARCTNASAFEILPSFAQLIRVSESLGTRLSRMQKL